MAFLSFLGRVLFVSVFMISAWQEYQDYGVDGGKAGKSLSPKFDAVSKYFTTQTGLQVPDFEIKFAVAAAIGLKTLGGIFFILGSSIGAVLLFLHQAIFTPILYDFYNYDVDKAEFAQIFLKFTQNLALAGALLFFIGMKNSLPRRTLKKKTVVKAKTG
ncbi:HR-like lesion-inducing protein-related [Heracleum sosnowskyi]|uniref:HR-like lesion-inducing protein-related n=1 Tax=Heracleum sosnowskyi TaxID=360622 RepID=A0AAD8J1U7_9APIA|nr:HR-like lesion-inducing protein-related [Heracleum sosnowskyi]